MKKLINTASYIQSVSQCIPMVSNPKKMNELVEVYYDRSKTLNLGCVKTSGFDEKKEACISCDTSPLFFVEPQEFSHCSNSKFWIDCGRIVDSQVSQKRFKRRDRTTSILTLKKTLFKTLEHGQRHYTIQVNSRPGNPALIFISIADVSHLTLTEDNLSEIFRLVNKHTLNKPYPLGDWPMRIGELVAYRPNHNGTHSARQTAYLDVLLDLVKNKGAPASKNAYYSLTDEEILNLRLAAYFLRSGRVDESPLSDPPADDYNTRSALIYEQYAKQLGVNSKTINWIKKLIFNSCKPHGVRDYDIDINSKNLFGYRLLSMVHELDLIRCYNVEKMQPPLVKIRGHLNYFVNGNWNEVNKIQEKLIKYAKDLCQATGCRRVFDNAPGDRSQFMKCSINGDYCWQTVKCVSIPTW